MKDEILRRSWVEVDLEQLKRNVEIYGDQLAPESQIMAVVKADAYGHGDIEVVRALREIGIDLFAVSNIKEALRVRSVGIDGTILVLGYTPIREIELAVSNDITQTIVCEEYAQEIIKEYGDKAKALKAHVALDTGMNRIGVSADNPQYCEQVIREWATKFDLTGAFTHLCVADSDDPESVGFTNRQIALFEAVMDRVTDLNLLQIHCLNSAGGLWRQTKYHDIVRLGIIMYGLKPDYQNVLPEGIKPVLTWKSVVSMVKTVKEGETIGYGRTYKTEKNMTVATIPTGYADGYNRHLSNKGFVLIRGAKAPIVGRVCMDQMMVDVTGIDCQMGEEVVLLGTDENNQFSADDMAQILGTIGYEIVCDIGRRVIRYY
jgi:alanine racemase